MQYLPTIIGWFKPHTMQTGLPNELLLAHSQSAFSRVPSQLSGVLSSWKMLQTKLYLCVISSFVFMQDVCPKKTKSLCLNWIPFYQVSKTYQVSLLVWILTLCTFFSKCTASVHSTNTFHSFHEIFKVWKKCPLGVTVPICSPSPFVSYCLH